MQLNLTFIVKISTFACYLYLWQPYKLYNFYFSLNFVQIHHVVFRLILTSYLQHTWNKLVMALDAIQSLFASNTNIRFVGDIFFVCIFPFCEWLFVLT